MSLALASLTAFLLSSVPRPDNTFVQFTPRWSQEIIAGGSQEFKLHYQTGRQAKFVALGDGGGILEVRVYDAVGNQVATMKGRGTPAWQLGSRRRARFIAL
jgi:hypothetical protein